MINFSMRSEQQHGGVNNNLSNVEGGNGDIAGKPPPSKPPKYSELYETGSTSNGSNLGTPPRYTSKPSSRYLFQ